MLESAQKPAESFPSDDTTALVVGSSAPPAEAVTVTVSKEIMDALKAGWTYRGRKDSSTNANSLGPAPPSDPETLAQEIAKQRKLDDEKTKKEKKKREELLKKGPPPPAPEGALSSSSSKPKSSSAKSNK